MPYAPASEVLCGMTLQSKCQLCMPRLHSPSPWGGRKCCWELLLPGAVHFRRASSSSQHPITFSPTPHSFRSQPCSLLLDLPVLAAAPAALWLLIRTRLDIDSVSFSGWPLSSPPGTTPSTLLVLLKNQSPGVCGQELKSAANNSPFPPF